MSLTCPNCHYILQVKVAAKPAKAPTSNGDISPLTDVVLADIFGFMKSVAPRTASTAELYFDYLNWTSLNKPPSKQAFAMALGRNGATRWRTSQARGYTIGEIAPDVSPATMTPEQRERFEAAHQRRGVLEHRGRLQAPGLSGLPFEVEGL